MTLESLANEFTKSERLRKEYPWVAKNPKLGDLTAGTLKLRGTNKSRVSAMKAELAPYARALVEAECAKHKVNLTPLSRQDIELLATAVVLRAVIATDEGALRFVAHELMKDQTEYPIGLFNSIEMLHMLEQNSRLTAEERRTTIDAWVRRGQLLPTNWRTDYERLFSELASSIGDS